MKKKVIDQTFLRFIVVGVINTIFGTTIMFVFYNVFSFSYFISTVSNYVFGSVLSYFLNKYFTFQSKKRSFIEVVKFVLNITICYSIAYQGSHFIVSNILVHLDKTLIENIAMVIGMIAFVLLNYIGQRMFVFNKGEPHES